MEKNDGRQKIRMEAVRKVAKRADAIVTSDNMMRFFALSGSTLTVVRAVEGDWPRCIAAGVTLVSPFVLSPFIEAKRRERDAK